MISAAIRRNTQPSTSRQLAVERAEAFSIPQLSRVAGVSERTLRNAFHIPGGAVGIGADAVAGRNSR